MNLFLSPHCDDAVFSCGGVIAQLVDGGERALIYTVMAGNPPSDFAPTPFTDELHARWKVGSDPAEVMGHRRDEDTAAAFTLGADILFGSCPDAVYRIDPISGVAIYPDVQAIFGGLHPHEPLAAPDLVDALLAQLPTVPTVIYAPLGVGHHVDHQLVRDLGFGLIKHFPESRLYFYEEYPYARAGRQAVLQALHELGQPLLRVQYPLDDAVLERKIAASACYRSQRSTFWDSDGALAEEIRAYTALTGGETCWRLLRPE